MAEEGFKRKLTAILSADVEGYSRLMGDDEESTVRTLTAYREVFFTLIQQHNGKVLDSHGDSLLAEFVSVVDAVQCGVAVQKEISARNSELPENRKMQFRIGINLGDVIQEEGRIYGDGVNIAARLEGLAKPGGICISKTAFDHIESKLPYGYEFLGDQTVKNIAKPVGAYRVLMQPRVTVAGEPAKEKRSPVRRMPILVGAAAVVALVIAVGVWQFYARRPSEEPASIEKMLYSLPDKPSIVVLPFDNMSKDPDQDYLVDGITDQIITGLSMIPQMFVIAKESSFSYKKKDVEVRQISEELGVQYVLEGSVQVSGNRIRITAQLIDALSGHHLWSERYDREFEDLFALQDEIMIKIMQAMQMEVTGLGILDDQPSPASVDVFKKILKGLEYVYRWNKEDMIHGRKLYEEAIALDPEYGPVHRLLAWTHYHDFNYRFSESPIKSLKKAEEIANKAFSLGDDKACALLSLIYLMNRQYEKAVIIGEKGLATSSNWAHYYAHFSGILSCVGRDREAISMIEKAIRLNPVTPFWYFGNASICYFNAGYYEKALEVAKKSIQKNPNYADGWFIQAASYSLLGRDQEASETAQKILEKYPSVSIEWLKTLVRDKNPAREKRWLDAYRKAGIPENPPLKLPDKPSFAVLPFTNMSGDSEQEYLSDGFTDTIIGALSRLPNLFVIARTSSFFYKGKSVTVKQVSQELGVQYIIEGSLQKSENQLRVTVKLIDALTGGHLWSERYDRNMKDIFKVQDEIVLKITQSIGKKYDLDIQARPTLAAGTNNLDAYFKNLKAAKLFWWGKLSADNYKEVKKLCREAIALDPNFVYPYCLLTHLYQREARYGFGESPEKSRERALNMAKRAVELDDSSSDAYSALGLIYYNTKQHDKALVAYRKAIELNPNNPESYYIGWVLCYMGRAEEAIPYFKTQLQVSPKYFGGIFAIGAAYIFMGKYENAIPYYNKSIDAIPKFWRLYIDLAACYAALGMEEESNTQVQKVLNAAPNFSVEKHLKRLPARNPEDIKYYAEALRKAPFPELNK
jgi:adenylate cyclase